MKLEQPSTSRKSRKRPARAGMRSYHCGGYIITRDRPWRWLVRHERFEPLMLDFMNLKFKRLGEAAAWAETH